MTEQMNVPKLRFDGFEGDWSSYRINDVSECVTSGSRDWAKYYSDKGDKFVRMTNLGREGINLLLEDMRYVSIPKGGSEGQRTSLQENDILISITAELGKIGIIPKDFGTAYINQHTALVRVNQQVNAKFLAQNLATKKSNKKINRLNDSGAKSGLNLSTIRNFEFTAPASLPEQQKIASFLSKVDEKIALLTEKKDKLTEYKKGVMQQLFNGKWQEQDGQLTFIPPTLRFKADDGSEFPDWEESALSKFAVLQSGYAFSSELFSDSGRKLITPKNFTKTGRAIFKDSNTKFTQENVDQKYLCKGGELLVLLTDLTPDCRLLGKPVLLEDDTEVLLNQRIVKFEITHPKSLNKAFVFQYFLTPKWNNRMRITATGTTVRHSSNKIVLNTILGIPSIDEQIKISNFLSAIDQKIELVNSELEKAKKWKKGLLQQMFV